MKKATLIIGIIVALAATAWAEDKPNPTKQELQAALKQISTEYQLIKTQQENLAYKERDALNRAQEIQAAIKKMDEAVNAAEKKDEKKEAKK
jgi:uncharacterized protein (DUF3084 family)